MDAYLRGRRLRLSAKQALGKGGEAEVFSLDEGRALKLWKGPDHPDLDGLPDEQVAARARIDEQQRKLPAFPRRLPPELVAPIEAATDRGGRALVGYTMERVDAEGPLARWSDPRLRRSGLSGDVVVGFFRRLHGVVEALHRAGVVIGDFNDQNVLVAPGPRPRIIDADSLQFGPYPARVFTARFVDPTLCDPRAGEPRLARPYTRDADWYAFAVLLFQSLLCVGPYGGLFQPKDAGRRVAPAARPLHRITVFHPEVTYPRPAIDRRSLPEPLLDRFQRFFERDERGPFPTSLLERLRFSTCASCGLEHARGACPACRPNAAVPAQTVVSVRGRIERRLLFSTRGVILHAAAQAGALHVVHHEDGAYRREDGTIVFRGPLAPGLRFATAGRDTLVGRRGELRLVSPGAPPRALAIDTGSASFATNARHRYVCAGGRLERDARSPLGEHVETIGEVLEGHTRIFIGPSFGLGLYRASTLAAAFLFDAERRGLNDALALPRLPGRLLDVAAYLDERLAWLFLAHEQGGRTEHLCRVYARSGELVACAEGEPGDGSFLGTMQAKVAAEGVLLCGTATGLCRIEVAGGALTCTRRYTDTEAFVDEDAPLLVGKEGLYVVGAREIAALRLT